MHPQWPESIPVHNIFIISLKVLNSSVREINSNLRTMQKQYNVIGLYIGHVTWISEQLMKL
uniref:Uncharacterized protein n=1 Tax=Anguilla anguilla TaxID=7936 RepID=A0A0E9UTJ9_ANGAN